MCHVDSSCNLLNQHELIGFVHEVSEDVLRLLQCHNKKFKTEQDMQLHDAFQAQMQNGGMSASGGPPDPNSTAECMFLFFSGHPKGCLLVGPVRLRTFIMHVFACLDI